MKETKQTTEEYQEGVRLMAQRVLTDLSLGDTPSFDSLPKEQLIELTKFAAYVYQSPFWDIIMKAHIDTQKDAATMLAPSYEITTFHRAIIVAFKLIQETLELHAKKFESMRLTDPDFDEDDPDRHKLI